MFNLGPHVFLSAAILLIPFVAQATSDNSATCSAAFQTLNENLQQQTVKRVDLSADEIHRLRHEADQFLKLKKWGLSIAPLRRIAKQNPMDWEAHSLIGKAYFRIENYPKAAEFLERAHAIKPDHPKTWERLASTYFLQKNFSQAAPFFDLLIAAGKGDTKVLASAVESHLMARNFKRAIEVSKILLKRRPDYFANLVWRVHGFEKARNYFHASESHAQLRNVINGQPALIERAASLFAKLGNHPRSLQLFQEYLDHDPTDGHRVRIVADTVEQLGDLRLALKAWLRVNELQPLQAPTLGNIARLQIRLNDNLDARESLQALLSLEPTNPMGLAMLTRLLLNLEDYRAALQITEMRISMNQRDPAAAPYGQRAMAYLGLKDYRKAKASIDKALELEPKSSISLSILAKIYLEMKDAKSAHQVLDSVLLQDFKLDTYWMLRAKAYSIERRAEAALNALDQLPGNQQDIRVRTLRASILIDLHRFDEAEEILSSLAHTVDEPVEKMLLKLKTFRELQTR